MNITKTQLIAQFVRAQKLGWLPFFVEAVETHTKGFFDEADLLAIASRETNLDPKWLKMAGDNGNGFGLMQADKRSFKEFTAGDGWKDARTGILFGARVLMHKWDDTMNCVGKNVVVRSSKGGVYGFKGKAIEGAEAQQVVIAAYNSGRWGHYAVSVGRPVDIYTTHGNYSGDVIERAKVLRPFIEKWKAENLPAKVTQVDPVDPNITSQNYDDPTREPNTVNPTVSPNAWDDALPTLITDAVDKEQVKTTTLSFAAKSWQKLKRPFIALVASLTAGNIYAWLGVIIAVIFTAWLIYSYRHELAAFGQNLFVKLKGKFA